MRVLAAALLLVARPALACSAFLLETPAGPVVGKSYDWSEERGLLLVNKRGVAKRALVLELGATPAEWQSRYASLTFNQYGREFPNGGINEAGLVVEVLILPDTKAPAPDGRPGVTELGLVQLLLDQAATVGEAVNLARRVRVVPAYAKLHYFVCDPTATCAALELLSGRLVVTTGGDMPIRAITNSTYSESRRALARAGSIAGGRPQSSLGRFVRIAGQVGIALSAGDGAAQAFAVLDTVRFAESTQWNVVYDLKSRRVHFRTRSHVAIKTVALGRFPASCRDPVMALDLLGDEPGDVGAAFEPYRPDSNLSLIEKTVAPMRRELPHDIVPRMAALSSSLPCVAP